MIDKGLLLSIAVMVLVVVGISRRFEPRTMGREELVDLVLPAVFVGVAVARLTAVAFEDPSALTRFGDLLIIRGGMELWAGALAGACWLAVSDHRRQRGVAWFRRLADVAPYGLAAMSAYEATCLLRDGCFGPSSAFGLPPGGGGPRQFPVGLAAAAGIAAVAALARRAARTDAPAGLVVAVVGLAGVRSLASVWLPRVSAGFTRQHRESLVVLVGGVVAGIAVVAWRSRRERALPGTTVSSSNGGGGGRKDENSPSQSQEIDPCL
ncbi:MAG: hypothetical protein ACR2KK_01930 [Acidimicrobiales bacterium]